MHSMRQPSNMPRQRSCRDQPGRSEVLANSVAVHISRSHAWLLVALTLASGPLARAGHPRVAPPPASPVPVASHDKTFDHFLWPTTDSANLGTPASPRTNPVNHNLFIRRAMWGTGTLPGGSPRLWYTTISQRGNTRRLARLPAAVPAPADNATTPERVALGKMLFFDARLSGDNRLSCASCHRPDKAFTDGLTFSPGAGGKRLTRNTPSCLNVGYYGNLFWDGRAATLEQQALAPLRSTAEMNQPLAELEIELTRLPGYVTAFQQAFNRPPDRQGVAQALAAFQRTLVTGPSPFVRFLRGDKTAISADAKAGFDLFRGEAGCIRCHHGPLLSDGKFYRLGVSFRDAGRAQVSGHREDRFRFRTPSLHQVAETGPYMHNGAMKTLEDVVTFYYRGIPDTGPDGLTPDTMALRGQSFSEIPLLVAFLESLTGKPPAVTPPRLP